MSTPLELPSEVISDQVDQITATAVSEYRIAEDGHEQLVPQTVALSAAAADALGAAAGEYVVFAGSPGDTTELEAVLLRVVDAPTGPHDVVIDGHTQEYFEPDRPAGEIRCQLIQPEPPVASRCAFQAICPADTSGLRRRLRDLIESGWEFVPGEVTTIPGGIADTPESVQVYLAMTTSEAPVVRCTAGSQVAVGIEDGQLPSGGEMDLVTPVDVPEECLSPAAIAAQQPGGGGSESRSADGGNEAGEPDSSDSASAASPDDADSTATDSTETASVTDVADLDGGIQRLGDSGVTFSDVTGLDEEIRELRKLIELPFRYPQAFDRLEVDRPTGVLLYGPPGTGKSLLAEAISNEIDATFRSVSASDVISKYVGQSETRLQAAFEEVAETDRPGIIFIDEIDSLAPSRSQSLSGSHQGAVTQLLRSMDGINANDDIVVVAATNKPDTIDEALRRGGRFDKELEIGVPDEEGRRDMLEMYLNRVPTREVALEPLVSQTRGFVGADIDQLFREASLNALERAVGEALPASGAAGPETALPAPEDVSGVAVTEADLDAALKTVEPSGMREFVVETPSTTWDDIGGVAEAKRQLKRAVQWPLNYGDVYDDLGTDTSNGVLLYGPPGTGKTMLARAVANESDANFISIRGPELINKYVGETEARLRDVFERARTNAPAIVFFDEIDAITGDRMAGSDSSGVTGRVVSQLLTEMDGLGTQRDDVNVIATTNRREAIDDALLRAGRFSTQVEVLLPDETARAEIFEVSLADRPVADDVDPEALAEMTAGVSGADISHIVEEAAARVAETHIANREGVADAVSLDRPDEAQGQDQSQTQDSDDTAAGPQLYQADLEQVIDEYDRQDSAYTDDDDYTADFS